MGFHVSLGECTFSSFFKDPSGLLRCLLEDDGDCSANSSPARNLVQGF